MNQSPNYFVRGLIIALSLTLLGITITSFFMAEPKYEISTGIITLVLIVVVLTLSESFNNMSIGKILTLSRKVETEKEQKAELAGENKELKSELFKIVSNIQQSQVNNTFNAPPEAWSKLLGVVKAEDGEDDDENEEEGDTSETTKTKTPARILAQERQERKLRKELKNAGEGVVLNKYLSTLPVSDTNFVKRVEFTNAFHAVDPIMDRRTIFDGYIQSPSSEIFVDIRARDMLSIMFMDRLYIKLNKVNLYRKAKKVDAKLLLLVMSTDFDEKEERRNYVERLYEEFKPAIENKLLEIKVIEVTKKEVLDANPEIENR
ncbi:hypothetical protein ACPV5U_16475 [Vibrio mediterranei]